MRNALSFEDSLKRVEAKVKPIDDNIKDEIIFPLIRKAFISFLESTNSSKE